MVNGRSVTINRRRHSGNLKVSVTNLLTDLPTNGLTGVGARDAYTSKKALCKYMHAFLLKLNFTILMPMLMLMLILMLMLMQQDMSERTDAILSKMS